MKRTKQVSASVDQRELSGSCNSSMKFARERGGLGPHDVLPFDLARTLVGCRRLPWPQLPVRAAWPMRVRTARTAHFVSRAADCVLRGTKPYQLSSGPSLRTNCEPLGNLVVLSFATIT